MASEYSVNIKLNTQQVKKDLKTIGTEIANLGIAGPGARASAQGQGQKTIKLSEFFQGGKFDKDKLNKLLLG